MGFSLAANYNDNEITRIKANPPELAGAGLTLVGRQSQGYLTSWTPKDKVVGTVRFTGGRFDVTASAIRYGEYKFTAAAPTNDQTFDPAVGRKSVGRREPHRQPASDRRRSQLFDKYPDEPRAANRFRGMNNYDLQAPAGGNGGYYYLTLNASASDRMLSADCSRGAVLTVATAIPVSVQIAKRHPRGLFILFFTEMWSASPSMECAPCSSSISRSTSCSQMKARAVLRLVHYAGVPATADRRRAGR